MSQPLAITVGDRFPVGERLYRLTPRLAESTIAARSVLLDIAEHREVITYGELSESLQQRIELVMRFFLALGEGVEAPVTEAPPQTSHLEEPTTSVMDAGSDTASIFEMGRM